MQINPASLISEHAFANVNVTRSIDIDIWKSYESVECTYVRECL